MGSTAESSAAAISSEMEQLIRKTVDEALAEKEAEREAKPKKMAIIATKGTLDWAYPPLILATTAAALGWEVGIFFTFYGLNIIHKKKYKNLKVAPLGNPAMPMPVPNIIGAIPGMTSMGTAVMKKMFKDHGVASIEDLLEMAVDMEVQLFPCAMTVEVFGYSADDFIDVVTPLCGAGAFTEYAVDADMSLFI